MSNHTQITFNEFADKLAKILGMLGSSHAGERASAGLKADEMVRSAGLTWLEVIYAYEDSQLEEPERRHQDILWCLKYPQVLNEWEKEFCASILKINHFSDKQLSAIERVVKKVSNYVEAER